MTNILSLGAINKHTGTYVSPKLANKKDKYICPECNKELILVQGKIRVHHFRHKVDSINPCYYYSKPTESQIHKDAKLLLKNLLERKIPISFIRNCCCCKNNEEFEIPEITETSVINIEYRFEYNGVKIADVAYIDNNEILCIFEICNTHKTCSENRPEPWFEINAETLLKIANGNILTSLQIPCIRCENCDDCKTNNTKQDKTRIIPNGCKIEHRIIPYGCDYINTDIFVYLNIEYCKKDMIKKYGGKWNPYCESFYIKQSIYNKNQTDVNLFIKSKIEWVYEHGKFDLNKNIVNNIVTFLTCSYSTGDFSTLILQNIEHSNIDELIKIYKKKTDCGTRYYNLNTFDNKRVCGNGYFVSNDIKKAIIILNDVNIKFDIHFICVFK